MYFHKIASALGMQCVVAVSSVKQMLMALRLPGIRAVSINNRNMATWAIDASRVDRILGDAEGEKLLTRFKEWGEFLPLQVFSLVRG